MKPNEIDGIPTSISDWYEIPLNRGVFETLIQISEAAEGPLLAFLDASKYLNTDALIYALKNVKKKESLAFVIKRLDSPDENVRIAAAEALGNLKDERAIEPLLNALSNNTDGLFNQNVDDIDIYIF